MKRIILSLLSLAVVASVGACAKNKIPPRMKPAPWPTATDNRPDEEETGSHSTGGGRNSGGSRTDEREHEAVVNPQPAPSKPIPDPPKPNMPEYAPKAEGKPGYVRSPYDAQHRLIDVRGLPPGTEAECPYTHRSFLVPP